jgi:hypothetical protein
MIPAAELSIRLLTNFMLNLQVALYQGRFRIHRVKYTLEAGP